MCGRYTLTQGMSDLERMEWFDELFADHRPRHNVSPGQVAPVVRRRSSGRTVLQDLKWGLVPHWADDPKIGYGMINARGESAHAKPAFRAAFASRRCLVPADGFYEWQKRERGAKQPFWVHRPDRSVFAMAGIWEVWKGGGDDEPLLTFAILTTPANDRLKPIHDRMPVVLDDEGRDRWMDPDAGVRTLRSLLAPAPAEAFESRAVSTYVNRPENEGPECIAALTDAPDRPARPPD